MLFSQFNEPLLDKRIFDILKHCKEKNISSFYYKWTFIE